MKAVIYILSQSYLSKHSHSSDSAFYGCNQTPLWKWTITFIIEALYKSKCHQESHTFSPRQTSRSLRSSEPPQQRLQHLPTFDVLDQTHLYSLTGRASGVSGKRTALSHAPARLLHRFGVCALRYFALFVVFFRYYRSNMRGQCIMPSSTSVYCTEPFQMRLINNDSLHKQFGHC